MGFVENPEKANYFTAPINNEILQHDDLAPHQQMLANKDQLSFAEFNFQFSQLEEKTNRILDELSFCFESYALAIKQFVNPKISPFNVVGSMLNIVRESGLRQNVELALVKNKPVMIVYGAGICHQCINIL